MAFCNPRIRISGDRLKTALRALAFVGPTLVALLAGTTSASAQGIQIIRDTEIERVLYSYERPLLEAAGIDPSTVHIYLNADPTINAFATQSPFEGEGEDIFVNTGLLTQLTSPNQVKGVLAHETGHIAGGDVIRGAMAMQKATIPMLLGMLVGVVAMVAGAGEAGMGAFVLGQQAAMSQYLQFSRAQESTADQRGVTYLTRTHQSAEGMLQVFEMLAQQQRMSAYFNKTFISDHPADDVRIDELRNRVDASPYKDVKDSPAVVHEFHMIQAKLIGYLDKPDEVLRRYPSSDQSDEALYARAMAYFREPDLKTALTQITTLIKREPKDPYFWEMYGQILVEMSKPKEGIVPYQKAVDLLPNAPLIRVSLAAAQIATNQRSELKAAVSNLRIAMQQDRTNTFGWYEEAQAYSTLGNQPMADLATAERYYWSGGMKMAAMFANRAAHKLTPGTIAWQRASDIVSTAASLARQQHDRG